MKIIKYSLNFNLKKKNIDSKSGVIRAVICCGGKRVRLSTGVSVGVGEWDAKKQRVMKTTKMANAQRANRVMESYRNTLDAIMAEYEVREAIPTADAISHRMNEAIKGESASPALSVSVAMEDFVREEGNIKNWSVSTVAKFHTLQRQINTVFGNNKRLWELDDKDLTDLVDWYKANGHNNSSIQRRVKQMRWFLRWAHNKGLYKGNLHETFRPKFKGVSVESKEIVYLEQDELRSLYEYDLRFSQPLERVRDVFCFCCFTGLRYSDVQKLRKENVREDGIHIVTQKTTDALVIPQNDFSKAILEKYQKYEDKDGHALPVISNQKANAILKDIGKIVGLERQMRRVWYSGAERMEETVSLFELLTTHCARRTFVVLALTSGVSVESIMKWTGHSSYTAMKPYIAITRAKQTNEMAKLHL